MTKPHDPTVAYQPSAELQDELGPLLNHRWGCRCTLHGRRLFGAALAAGTAVAALPALAREGVEVGEQSQLSRLVSAGDVEKAAQMQYGKLIADARQQGALAAPDHPQLVRLRTIADRIVPFAKQWNRRAESWQWEINLINSKQVNAFCMPGGKIAFFTAILDDLKLTDDEVAMVMGHEMAHALREHAREQMSKSAATGLLAGVVSNLLGLGNTGNAVLNMSRQLLTLKFGREDETEADLVGMELAARSGYDPRAGISLWEKMGKASKGAPPQFMSTHPSGKTRIQDIQASLPKVLPLFDRAPKPPRRFDANIPR